MRCRHRSTLSATCLVAASPLWKALTSRLGSALSPVTSLTHRSPPCARNLSTAQKHLRATAPPSRCCRSARSTCRAASCSASTATPLVTSTASSRSVQSAPRAASTTRLFSLLSRTPRRPSTAPASTRQNVVDGEHTPRCTGQTRLCAGGFRLSCTRLECASRRRCRMFFLLGRRSSVGGCDRLGDWLLRFSRLTAASRCTSSLPADRMRRSVSTDVKL
uniref:Uncharacterized protein n=1 Tax=Arundo donax TaxID=35708 RepID=A0A0A9CEF5_ARUDO